MLEWFRLPPAAAAAVAFVPGILALVLGRGLARHVADPAAPERLLAYRGALQRALAGTIAVLILLAGVHALWAVPLALLAARAGAYPSRRRFFEEEWTFSAYLLHGARVFCLLGGFWILLASTPWVVKSMPLGARTSGIVVALLLVAWNGALPRLTRFAFEARPLDDAALSERLLALADRSRARRPEILRGGPRGARWANALALPSIERPGVLLSDTLLSELTPDESAAIFAHELAHLEHFDRRRLVGARATMWLAIGLACLLGVALRTSPRSVVLDVAPAGYVFAILVGLVLLARRRRAHESESDRRAVEICGDADALIRALTRLHAIAKLPRRFSSDLERRATHPSLARRIAALRAHAAEAPPIPATNVFPSADTGRWLILGPERLHVLEGVAAGTAADPASLGASSTSSRAVRYEALHELRVAVAPTGPVLLARETAGPIWRVRLVPTEVPRLQSALDLVDGRLAPPAAFSRTALRARLAGAVGLCAAILPGGIGALALPSLLAVALPSRAALGALGASALACSGLVLRRRELWPWLPAFVAVLCVACALLAIGLLLAPGRDESRGATAITAGTLAIATVLVGARIALAASDLHAGVLHVAARAHPGAVVFLLGTAGALASASRTGARAARLLAVLALVPLLLGSTLFLAAADDPLVFAGREATVTEKNAEVARRDSIDFVATRLRLSPAGGRWAAHREDGGGGWVVGDFGGARRRVAASDLVLVDDRRALALAGIDEDDDGSTAAPELRLLELDPDPRLVWSRPMPRLGTARVEMDAGATRWRVTGVDFRTRELVRVTGALDGEDRRETRWPSPPSKKGVPLSSWSAGDGDAIVVVEKLFEARPSVYLHADDVSPWHSEIWAVAPGARRRVASTSLTVRCLPALAPDAVCVTVTPDATYLWSVDPKAGEPRPLTSVRGRAREEARSGDGPIALWSPGTGLLVVDPRAKRAERWKLPEGAGWATSIAASRAHVGLVTSAPSGYAVLVVAP